ncbi:MAG: energy transducer TonB [Sphingobacteriales bacterium]|nr:MAG: energy transducer TonB [Sphingobacteriales bacterium]
MKKLFVPLALLLLTAGTTLAQKSATGAPSKQEKVLLTADVMPEFQGNLQSFLAKTVTYPADARKRQAEGRVVIKFVIAEDGRVTDAIVERGVDPVLDAEALRAIQSMPRWKPATNGGKPVKVYYRVPVSFKLA